MSEEDTMATHTYPPYARPPSTSPPMHPNVQDRPFDPVKSHLMEIDRTQREQSVLSGMSIEDMEAAETLNSLHRVHSPKHSQGTPVHIQTSTSFPDDQPEPLLSLVLSQYPLAGAVINGSLSAYKTTQSYIPGAQWTERNVGLPLAGTVARISGVEGSLRRALQSRKDSRQTPKSPDTEKGLAEAMSIPQERSISDASYPEALPAYNAADRSPPYEQQALLTRDRQAPPGWRQQLFISTSGLGIAMSDESLRSLRYCLSWLKWANGNLAAAIQSLKDLLDQWGIDPAKQDLEEQGLPQHEREGREAALAARISAVKAEVLQTLKQVMTVVSTYAGGALPDNARNLVHRHLTSLPRRFSIASAMSNNPTEGEESNDAATNANRVMVLAQEGLDMMTQVSRVVNGTLMSAEAWCEKLGRRNRSSSNQHSENQPLLDQKKEDPQNTDMVVDQVREADGDVKMEM